MTVCLAVLFRWNYAGRGELPVFGVGAITASDRMITAADVQYEPNQQKMAFVPPRTVILISGDFATHSYAIRETQKAFSGKTETNPYDIALTYGRAIQSLKRRQAEDAYLAPIGLNTDIFLAQQRDYSEAFVSRISDQLQSYRGEDTEAIVVGSDGADVRLFVVESNGSVNSVDDVGFAAIGIGAFHAKSRLMQGGYASNQILAPAIAAAYAAKRAADIAPGVGRKTDMHIILRGGPEPLWPNVFERVEALYEAYEDTRKKIAADAIKMLQDFIAPPEGAQPDAEKIGIPGGDTQTDAGAAKDAAETPRKNEGGQEKAGS